MFTELSWWMSARFYVGAHDGMNKSPDSTASARLSGRVDVARNWPRAAKTSVLKSDASTFNGGFSKEGVCCLGCMWCVKTNTWLLDAGLR